MTDVLIVGAGTAGYVLADQLNRSGRLRVKLIEAGGAPNMNAQIHQWCHPADCAGWVEAGASGWGWDEVTPVFAAMERWSGDDAAATVALPAGRTRHARLQRRGGLCFHPGGAGPGAGARPRADDAAGGCAP